MFFFPLPSSISLLLLPSSLLVKNLLQASYLNKNK
nr:MAG TPA: hypothetical protein [Caudoviricetes sp.]